MAVLFCRVARPRLRDVMHFQLASLDSPTSVSGRVIRLFRVHAQDGPESPARDTDGVAVLEGVDVRDLESSVLHCCFVNQGWVEAGECDSFRHVRYESNCGATRPAAAPVSACNRQRTTRNDPATPPRSCPLLSLPNTPPPRPSLHHSPSSLLHLLLAGPVLAN